MSRRPTQIFDAFGIAFVLFLTVSCADNSGQHVMVDSKPSHLADLPAGFWLKWFDIDYTDSEKRIKKQITDQLRDQGTLVEEFIREDGANSVKTFVYEYRGTKFVEEYYKGGTWKGPKIVPFQEYYNGGWNSWITIHLSEPISYSKLLPDHYTELKLERRYEHTATIESEIDQMRRLFLFGHGDKCNRITLF